MGTDGVHGLMLPAVHRTLLGGQTRPARLDTQGDIRSH